MKTRGNQPEKPSRTAEIEQAVMLVQRLERLSADSTWAHLASGMRGAILRCIGRLESGGESAEAAERTHLKTLVMKGFELLENAALELTAASPLAEVEVNKSDLQDTAQKANFPPAR